MAFARSIVSGRLRLSDFIKQREYTNGYKVAEALYFRGERPRAFAPQIIVERRAANRRLQRPKFIEPQTSLLDQFDLAHAFSRHIPSYRFKLDAFTHGWHSPLTKIMQGQFFGTMLPALYDVGELVISDDPRGAVLVPFDHIIFTNVIPMFPAKQAASVDTDSIGYTIYDVTITRPRPTQETTGGGGSGGQVSYGG